MKKTKMAPIEVVVCALKVELVTPLTPKTREERINAALDKFEKDFKTENHQTPQYPTPAERARDLALRLEKEQLAQLQDPVVRFRRYTG